MSRAPNSAARVASSRPTTKERRAGWAGAELPLQLWADVEAELEPSLDLYEQLRDLDDGKELHEVIGAISYRGGAPLAQQLFAKATEAIERGELTPTRSVTYAPPCCAVGPDGNLPPIPDVHWFEWERLERWVARQGVPPCTPSGIERTTSAGRQSPEGGVPASAEGVSIREAAARLGVHPTTIRRWIRQGRVQYVQPGGKGGRLLVSLNMRPKGGAVATQGREENHACDNACESSSRSASESEVTDQESGLSSFDPRAEEVATDLLRRWEASQRRKPSRRR